MKVNPRFKLLVYMAFLFFILGMLGVWYSNVIFLRNWYQTDCLNVVLCDCANETNRREYFPDVSFKNCVGIHVISNKCKAENLPQIGGVVAWKAYKLPVRNSSVSSTFIAGGWWSYPSEIVEITADPNELLVLVNKKYKLPATYVPSGLINLGDSGVRNSGHHVGRVVMLDDLKNMGNDARAAGIDLAIRNAYRSYGTQQSIYNNWLKKYGNDYSFVDTFSARPGHSQHQLGTTIDFTTSESNDLIGDVFNSTRACSWLAENAWKYGFVLSYPSGGESITGYKYEGWHYRYIGVDNASAFKDSGLTLDQYLATQPINNY